jgi:hypothetical protein
MKFQSTDWVAEFVCFCLDGGLSVVVASNGNYTPNGAQKVVHKATSLFAEHRPKVHIRTINSYFVGFTTCTMFTENPAPYNPVVTIAFDDDGTILDFSFGKVFLIEKKRLWSDASADEITLSEALDTATAEYVYQTFSALYRKALEE